MHRQALIEKKRRVHDRDIQAQRFRAVEVLRAEENVAEVFRYSGISCATCDRLKSLLDRSYKN